MTVVQRVELTLLEPLFFASREVDRYFLTEPVVGNYALAYALGLVNAPWSLGAGQTHLPSYDSDLASLNERGIYVTPASPIGAPRLVVERWNALSDTYWYAMGQNVVAAELDHRLGRAKARPTNFPQAGRVRLVARGSRFYFHSVSREGLELPPYVRLGKWMSKTRVEVARTWRTPKLVATPGLVASLQNAADLERSHEFAFFDLVSVPPVPLLGNVQVTKGGLYDLGDELLPAGLAFAFPDAATSSPGRSRRRAK